MRWNETYKRWQSNVFKIIFANFKQICTDVKLGLKSKLISSLEIMWDQFGSMYITTPTFLIKILDDDYAINENNSWDDYIS